jgi:fructose-1,6-bisphosphatase/inositol monophosphatase family enzyme
MAVAALEAVDRRLRIEMAALAEEVRHRAVRGVGLEEVRVRSDGDTTHAFDADLEERLLRFFTVTGLPVRFSSEERPDVDLVSSPELLALVDPLDGSAMVARGYPSGSISVSVVDLATEKPVLSRIAEVFTGFQYSALGATALKNGAAMRPSGVRSVGEALVVSYFASSSRTELFRRSPVRWEACWMLRNYGGLVDIAKVGAGQCDAMVEALKGFVAREYVAGVHIAEAAGAVATTLEGEPVPVLFDRSARCRFVVAATTELHDELLRLLVDCEASPPHS